MAAMTTTVSLPIIPPGTSSHIDRTETAVADSSAWPDIWPRCWVQIRTWPLPPRWVLRDWYDEARDQGALAYCLARRDFDPTRGVPFEAFVYRRVLHAVWTRYRQEWSFGRRAKTQEVVLGDADALPPPDADLCQQMTRALERLKEADRQFIRRLFWDSASLADLSVETGLLPEALKKRKARALVKLREFLRESI
jgi:hypothetical protein